MAKNLCRLLAAGVCALLFAAPSISADPAPAPEVCSEGGKWLPRWLSETGWADGAAGLIGFTPRFPLWSDGASKRRWLALPPGTSIDAADPQRWEFPPGTRLWKEFAYQAAVETRFIVRADSGTWCYASYVWNADLSQAELVPAVGLRLARADAPGGRYRVPSRLDCTACHEGGTGPVLGMSPLQLSAQHEDSTPSDLSRLVAEGWLINLPQALLSGVAIASDNPREVAALGYLHGNCGHCHNGHGPLSSLGLNLHQSVGGESALQAVRNSLLSATKTTSFGLSHRVLPGKPEASQLLARLGTRNPYLRMPPLGTSEPDPIGTDTIALWIAELKHLQEKPQ